MNIFKFGTFTIGAIVAIQSTYLTYQFLSNLSPTLGYIGISMETIKFFVPMFAVMALRKKAYIRFILMALISITLAAVSFSASYSTVQDGFSVEHQSSAQYKSLTKQIELKTEQLNSMPNGWITKRGKITDEISSLLDKRSTLVIDDLGAKYGKLIAIIIAAIIEILTIATTIALTLFDENKEEMEENIPEQNDEYNNVQPVLARDEAIEVVRFAANDFEYVHISEDIHMSIENKIRSGLLHRKFERPSVNCIRKSITGIASEKISDILREYGEQGLLIPRGERGWKYA